MRRHVTTMARIDLHSHREVRGKFNRLIVSKGFTTFSVTFHTLKFPRLMFQSLATQKGLDGEVARSVTVVAYRTNEHIVRRTGMDMEQTLIEQ